MREQYFGKLARNLAGSVLLACRSSVDKDIIESRQGSIPGDLLPLTDFELSHPPLPGGIQTQTASQRLTSQRATATGFDQAAWQRSSFMAVIRSQCPKCRKILKLKTKAALGKRVPCPQCSEPFVVAEYEPPELVDDFLDDEEGETFDYAGYEESGGGGYDDGYDDYYGEEDYEDDYDEAPRRKTTRAKSSAGGKKTSKSKKKKKSAGLPAWAPMALIGVGAVAVVGGIVGALIAFGPFGGGSSNVMNLAWLPGDADLYMEVKPSEMWNAQVLAPVRENPTVKQALAQMPSGQAQIQPTDITSITFAMSGIGGAGAQQMMNPFGMAGQQNMLMVMRTSKVMDETELQTKGQEADHNGKKYYKDPAGQAMYMADSKTLLMGTEAMLTAALDRGSVEPRVEWLDFADSSHQFLMVMKVPANSGAPAPDEVAQTLQKAQSGFFALSLGSDIEMKVGVNCATGSDADMLKSKLDEAMAKAKTEFAAKIGQVPPQFAKIADIGKSTIDSVSASKSGPVLTVSAEIPGSISTEIANLAKDPMMGMMLGGLMAQGMGGLGGGPPGLGGGAQRPGTTMVVPNGGTPGQTGSNPLAGASEAAQRSQSKNNLKQLMLAVHNYHDVYGHFPQSAITGPDGQTKHSWRVALLPFLEERDLYEQYKLDQPWDSPANMQVLARMPAVFRHPSEKAGTTTACYYGLTGPDTAMGDGEAKTGFRDVRDGTSNTVFVVEAKRTIPWTKPEDIPVSTGGALPAFGGFSTDGFHAGLCDGSSRYFLNSIDRTLLGNLINRRDGNAIQF